MADWVCPNCGRRFSIRYQSHSCQARSVETLFTGHPDAVRLYYHIREAVEGLGPVEVAITKSQASFRAPGGARFCWVWRPPEGVKGISDEAVVVTFGLPYRLESPRIREVVEPQPGRFTHHLVLDQEAQLDDEAVGWLREARIAALGRAKRGRPVR